MFQAAIIGVNGYASTYLPQLERLENEGKLRLAAAVIRNPGKRPEVTEKLRQRGVRIFTGTDELYAEFRPDIVFIPTGIEFHEPMTLAALEHGCNVFVEKPASASVASVERMIAMEEKHPGLFAAVGFQHIYDRNIQHFKQCFSGALGRPRKITVKGCWPRNDSYYARNDWAGKLHSSRGGLVLDSPVNNAFAHHLNVSLFLSGSTFPASAPARILDAQLWRARPEIETFDSCRLLLRTDTGTEIDAFFSHTVAANLDPQLHIECEHGTVDWQQNSEWKIIAESGKEVESGSYGDPNTRMFNDIAAKLQDPSVFCCPLRIALEHTRIIEELHRNYPITPVPPEQVKRNPENGQLVFPAE